MAARPKKGKKKRRELRGVDAVAKQVADSAALRRDLDRDGNRRNIEDRDKRLEQTARAKVYVARWRQDRDPSNHRLSDLSDLMAAADDAAVQLSAQDIERISEFVNTQVLLAARRFPESQATGFFRDILLTRNVTAREFALQATDNSKRALEDYIRQKGDTGEADARLLRSLIAMGELHQFGAFDSLLGGAAVESVTIAALRDVATMSEEEKLDVLDAYNINEDEATAIEHYTNANTNSLMKDSFGSARTGWFVLSVALAKFPSTGSLGWVHAGIRVPRTDESTVIERLPARTQIYHGNRRMGHGQRHFMSTATTYNVHTTTQRIAEAGGIIAIQGTSGKYINPFGVQGTLTDGAEVLYPPGVMSEYLGSSTVEAVHVHQLRELTLESPMVETMVEDLDYREIPNPYYIAPAPEPRPTTGLRRVNQNRKNKDAEV